MRICRPTHWLKNLFVFAPLIVYIHSITYFAVLRSIATFIIFCLAASSVYIINDFFDLKNDQAHPKKKWTRPLAAGELNIQTAIYLILGIWLVILLAAFFLPKVVLIACIYILLNIAYSVYLKHFLIIDIILVALGFVLRVLAGIVALNEPISPLVFSITFCVVIFITAIKREKELQFFQDETRNLYSRYTNWLKYTATIFSFLTIVFYLLYVLTHIPVLLITLPLVAFGLYRYWRNAQLYNAGDSPTDTLLGDKILLLNISVWMLLVIGLSFI